MLIVPRFINLLSAEIKRHQFVHVLLFLHVPFVEFVFFSVPLFLINDHVN